MLHEIFRAWHIVFASVGCVANLLLGYVAVRKTPSATRSYATLIINFAVTDFVESFLNLFLQMRLIAVPFNATLIYVYHGFCQYTGSLSCRIGTSFFYHCFPHTAWSLLISFSYRYYILNNTQLARRTLVIIVLVFYMPSLFQALIYWPSIVGREEILPYAEQLFPQYNLSQETAVIGGRLVTDFAFAFVILHGCVPIFPIYICIFVLRTKIVNNLMRKAALLSNEQKANHIQILKCLTIQSLIPSLFLIGVVCYACAQLGILSHPILEYSMCATVIPMPMFSAVTYLSYVRPYRSFCLKLIGWERRTSVSVGGNQSFVSSAHRKSIANYTVSGNS